jgi:hypothetical protein
MDTRILAQIIGIIEIFQRLMLNINKLLLLEINYFKIMILK